ncbi:MAG: hypothetical protein C4K49_09285 [Candidatus Thorarchaeota archaeon]|nr:MAG: hypothetical protein C4K49_09285 [Candidatus Thorarchaeota archaeon]
MKKERPNTYSGNAWWAARYALTSLRNYPVRNAGIALVLAIGVALPTTVFVWTSTGTYLVVDDYFATNPYQFSLEPKIGESVSSSDLLAARQMADASQLTEWSDLVSSTLGILTGDFFPSWSLYSPIDLNYALGIKDMRVILVTEEVLGNWSQEFDCRGNFSLSGGQVLVSDMFVGYARQVHGVDIDVGSVIDFDLFGQNARNSRGNPFAWGRVAMHGFTVAGVYQVRSLTTLISQSFPSMSRKNWDPMSLTEDPVLGINDSVMILRSEVSEDVAADVETRSFFSPVCLLRASEDALLALGPEEIGNNLLALKTQIEGAYTRVSVNGLEEIWSMDARIKTYLQSQVLTVIAFPVLIMSLMLSVFTSETSIARRKGEISALRSKGASFNQVFATFMWESLLLSLLGLGTGLVFSVLMAPLMGSSVGLFMFDPNEYLRFLNRVTISPVALAIAAAIALYLPAAYLLHVARRIDVSEVGQPTVGQPSEEAEQTGIWRYVLGLTTVLVILLLMPLIIAPRGSIAVLEILGATMMLFIASYLGSRAMRLATGRLSGSTAFLLGEKSLYLSQSLRRRKGQFIPLLVILTLTLTTTTMMLIQAGSFEATLDNELRYSIGCDLRIECDQRPLSYNRTLMDFPGVTSVTPVLETWAQVGAFPFFLEGIDAANYARIGYFSPDSFITGDAQSVLSALGAREDGIILSEYYSRLWNETVGDTIAVYFGTINATRIASFEIVGIMRSAPGFGVAATYDLQAASFASQFGFQVGQGGFAFVNLNLLSSLTYYHTSDLFLVDTACFSDMTLVQQTLDSERNVFVYSPETFDTATSYSVHLFLSGIQGLTVISFVLCGGMGLSAIGLFLGSAVKERDWEYAVFRALGGTKKQVLSMVFGEFAGSVIAAMCISLALGAAFGYSMSLLTFGIAPFSPALGEILAFPFTVMLLVMSVDAFAMLASCYIPALKAGAVNPAVVLRNL